MDNRRFVTFLVFFFAFTWIYTNVVIPKFFPAPPAPVVDLPEKDGDGNKAAENDPDANPDARQNDPEKAETADTESLPDVHPRETVTLGSTNADSGYFLEVKLSSVGAAIESVRLADPKFRDLVNRDQQVQVLGNNLTEDRTFSLAVSEIDRQLEKHSLTSEAIDWKLESSTADEAVFSLESPDHTLRVEKTFRIHRVDVPEPQRREAFLKDSAGFTLELDLKVSNLSDAEQNLIYELQGPVGVILENAEHTRKFRDIKIEFLGDSDDVTLGAKALDKLYQTQIATIRNQGEAATESQIRELMKQREAWTDAFRYAGVDVQFFAALVAPLDDRSEEQRIAGRLIDRTYPVLIQRDLLDINHSDVSFRMASSPVSLKAEESVTHRFALFVGPKRSDLLDPEPMQADQVLDYGSWFGFIARGMHFLLDTFYRLGMPYALAIICLTVLVRGCMFPLSRKQAISAAKMKELQPRLNELKTKFGDDKQKLAQAQMELWRKHDINPLGGCFPLFFQLPIFVALYTCLNTAVDLRLSSFLWIENLAAPDALFRMPWTLPMLGRDFNLLPCITVVLFYLQQKMFMPPPADEQQEMQQKMMNMMTLVFGFMFWHMPAGLCLYFIASSLWGIAERKLLGTTSAAMVTEPNVVVKDAPKPDSGRKNAPQKPAEPKKAGFFEKLMEAAEEARRQAEKNRPREDDRNGGKNSKKRK